MREKGGRLQTELDGGVLKTREWSQGIDIEMEMRRSKRKQRVIWNDMQK